MLHHAIHLLARFFNDGGVFMWVILVVFAISWAVVFERLIYYYALCRGEGARLMADVARMLNANEVDAAKAAVSKRRIPLYVLFREALQRYSAGMKIDEIQQGVEEAAIKEMPKMTQRLNYLALFANIGTLLGLLGTIIGLQTMFSSLAAVEASKKAAMLASGISQAMNTTAFGLIVAIPCMVMYTFLFNKQQGLTKDLDESVVRLLNYLKKKMA